MRRRPRTTLLTGARACLAAVGACSAAACASPAGRGAQPGRTAGLPAPGTLVLHPERVPLRDGGFADAERGMLYVSANRARRGPDLIAVEVWRFRVPDGGSRNPPVFRLHGGPGFEGLAAELAEAGYYERVIRPTTRFADYVVVGQRGIGASRPNTVCAPADSGPADFSRRCRAFWEAAGLDLSGFNVNEAADDVADAARALGYARITLRGGSFGSHWAMAVMRRHPQLVARAMLSGTEGPDHTIDRPAQVLAALGRIAGAAEASGRFAALMPPGGLMAVLDSLRSRLRASPVTVRLGDSASGRTDSVSFGERDLRGLAFGFTGNVSTRRGIRTWPADLLRAYHGDFEAAARRRIARMRPAPEAATSPWPPSLQTAAEYLLDCASGASPGRLAAIRADSAAAIVGEEASWHLEVCGPWGVDLGAAFRANFDTDIPTLIVHGDWDISTPYENALELAPHFRAGRLVTVVGGTHAALPEAVAADPAFAAAVEAFLRSGDLAALPDSVVLPPIEWVVPPDLVSRAAARPR